VRREFWTTHEWSIITTGRPENIGKRRTFKPDFKLEAVLDMMRGEKTVAHICRERDITESWLYKWRDAFFERAPHIFADQRGGSSGSDPQAERIAELERLVGRQSLELEALKKRAACWSQHPS
jgi:transposase-like protein